MPKPPPALFLRSAFILTACAVLFIFMSLRSGSPRTAYATITGVITHIGPAFGTLPDRNPGKNRYIQLNGRLPVLEIFVGKDRGDFSPAFERIDALRTGDTITAYFDQKLDNSAPSVNRHVTFIDKGRDMYFEKGNAARPFLIGSAIFCGLAVAGLYILKALGRIR